MTSTEFRLSNNGKQLVSDNVLSRIEQFVDGPAITASECLSVLKLMNEYLLCRAYDSMLKNYGKNSIDSNVEIGVHEGLEYLYDLYSELVGEQCGPDFEDIDDFRFPGNIEIRIAIGSDESIYDSIEDFVFSMGVSGMWMHIERFMLKWKDSSMSGYISFDSADIQSIVRHITI